MSTHLLNAFGRAVRLQRTSLGMSQEELAVRSSSHRNYIGAIERGERNPTLSKIAAIGKALGVAPSDLVRAATESRVQG